MTEYEGSFSLKEVVTEIRDDVKALAVRLDRIDREGSIGTRQELVDHEGRLRKLENAGFRLQGVWATIGVVAAVLTGIGGLALGAAAFLG